MNWSDKSPRNDLDDDNRRALDGRVGTDKTAFINSGSSARQYRLYLDDSPHGENDLPLS
jgi:hypothetical protein